MTSPAIATGISLRVSRSTLLAELQLCAAIVDKRATIPILGNVLISAADDRLSMAATDLDVTLRTSCEARIEEVGRLAIESAVLAEIVRSLPDDDVHITAEENGAVIVSSGTSRFTIPSITADDYPTLPTVDTKDALEIEAAVLKEMIGSVQFAATREESRFTFNGIAASAVKRAFEVFATDGHRVSVASVSRTAKASATLDSILIPLKAAHAISKFDAPDDASILLGVSDGQLFANCGHRSLIARMIDQPHLPKWRDHKPATDKTIRVDRARLAQAIRRTLVVATASRAIKFEYAPGKLTLSTRGDRGDRGAVVETIPIDYAGAKLTIGYDGRYIAEFLEVLECETVTIAIKDENSPSVITPNVPDSVAIEKTYLCATMRIA